MKLFRFEFCILFWGFFCPYFNVQVHSQENSGSSIVSDLVEELVAAEIEPSSIEEITEDLFFLYDHPINLNSAGEEDLKRLHVLNDFQIYTLLEYIREYGPILSGIELQTIIGFTSEDVLKIEPFVIFSPIPNHENNLSSGVQQEIVFRFGSNMQKTNVIYTDSLTNSSPYLGKNRSLLSRYQIKSGSRWIAGLTMEQDPGEAFKPPSKCFGPDFMSAFIEVKNLGIINSLIIGDFRTSYGQGLVLSGYPCRKGIDVLLKPARTGIRKYTSSGENDYLRGIGIKLGKDNINGDIFFSFMQHDATIYEDSCKYFKSFSSTGLHRTEAELGKKDALLISSFGSHVNYKTQILDLGFTFFSQKFNADYLIKTDPFSSDIIRKGDAVGNISTDVKLNLNRFILFGEIASDFKGRSALITGLLTELHPLVKYSFIFRKYHPSYLAPRAGGFGEKSTTRNEEGFYMGIEMYPWKSLRLDLFSDHYTFPFLDVSTTGPSSGNEYFLNCFYSYGNSSEFKFRTRFEKSQNKSIRNGTGIDLMDVSRKISVRFEFKNLVLPMITLKSRTEFSYYKEAKAEWLKGYYCGTDLGFEHKEVHWRFWVRYAVFDIPGWDTRIYAYENDVLYSFTTPAYNSKGSRVIFMTKFSFLQKVDCWVRYSSSILIEAKTKGMNDYKLKRNKSPYLTLQLRIKI